MPTRHFSILNPIILIVVVSRIIVCILRTRVSTDILRNTRGKGGKGGGTRRLGPGFIGQVGYGVNSPVATISFLSVFPHENASIARQRQQFARRFSPRKREMRTPAGDGVERGRGRARRREEAAFISFQKGSTSLSER